MRGLLRVAFLPILGKRIISIDMKGSSMNIRDFMLALLLMWPVITEAQPFSFAHVTDTHVGGSTGAEDLERTVRDLNAQAGIDFVLVTGDVTEFGSRRSLKKPAESLTAFKNPGMRFRETMIPNGRKAGATISYRFLGLKTSCLKREASFLLVRPAGPTCAWLPPWFPVNNCFGSIPC